MRSILLSFVIFIFARPVFSELNQNFSYKQMEHSIIDDNYMDEVTEESTFPNQQAQRDIAQQRTKEALTDSNWDEHLEVLTEIPYSEVQLSHSSLQRKVLSEMKSR